MKLKFKTLKKLDGRGLFRRAKLSVFGASSHLYKLNDGLSETALADFEKSNLITLPVFYKSFLNEMGNGGAGPYYGLLKLHDWSIELEIVSNSF